MHLHQIKGQSEYDAKKGGYRKVGFSAHRRRVRGKDERNFDPQVARLKVVVVLSIRDASGKGGAGEKRGAGEILPVSGLINWINKKKHERGRSALDQGGVKND